MGRDAAGVRGIRLRPGDAVVSLDVAADDTDILIVTDAGYGKRTKLERFNRQARGGQGVRGIRLTGTRGTVVAAFMVALDEEILLVSSGGVVIRTAAREIASQGRDATGVRVMNLDDGQTVAAVARVAADDTDILIVTDAGYGKRTKLERFNRQARGGQGVRGIRLTGKRGSVVAAFMVALDEEILLVSSGGVVIRTQAREIASQGLDATGVRVMNLDDGQSVAAVARVNAETDED